MKLRLRRGPMCPPSRPSSARSWTPVRPTPIRKTCPTTRSPTCGWRGAPGRAVVAIDDDGTFLGAAKMGPNRPGRGAHIGTASFMVSPAARGKGVGRALARDMIDWHRRQRYAGIQFNAVVETNMAAVRLWQDLGFRILGTVPGAFRSATHGPVGLHVMFLDLSS